MRPKGLNFREREILRIVIEEYIEKGAPVSSALVSRLLPFPLSPATVRNVMMGLEEKGYLYHKYHASGRIPTDKALRYYIKTLINSKPWQDQQMELRLADSRDLYSILERASKFLSEFSDNVALVVSPKVLEIPFFYIKFIRIFEKRILLFMVTLNQLVVTKNIELSEDIPQNKLDFISRFLNENYRGKTLAQIKEILKDSLIAEGKVYRKLIQKLLTILHSQIQKDVFVEGQSKIIEKIDISDIEKLKKLFALFEEKSRILDFLNQLELSEKKEKIEIFMGSESEFPYADQCVLIVSSYGAKGLVAIFGPKRMRYLKALAALDRVGSSLNKILSPGG